ncbi:hypothetical protein KJ785_05230, partial [Patescibacteria group bacterium]|nr:hypothetical protein [Patescibacteria group bacterium]
MFDLNNIKNLEKKVTIALAIIVVILGIIFIYLRWDITEQKNNNEQGGLTRPTSTEDMVISNLEIITTDQNPEVGNIFGITVQENGSKPSGEVTVLLNGKPVGTCGEDEENCNIILGPFDETGAGNYDYEVQVKDK